MSCITLLCDRELFPLAAVLDHKRRVAAHAAGLVEADGLFVGDGGHGDVVLPARLAVGHGQQGSADALADVVAIHAEVGNEEDPDERAVFVSRLQADVDVGERLRGTAFEVLPGILQAKVRAPEKVDVLFIAVPNPSTSP